MGCTASSQSRTTAQSPAIQTANAANVSPKNDPTPADPKQENQVQPLAASSAPEQPAKPGTIYNIPRMRNIYVIIYHKPRRFSFENRI